ncbi:MAG: hypothetical protein H0U70_00435 [Tatlockia sp.]|nr:hypothetical protein [Tatlockia sp.]
MNKMTAQAIRQLLLDSTPLANQLIDPPYDYASLRESILQIELKQEIQALKNMLEDNSIFEEKFKRHCAARAKDNWGTIPFQLCLKVRRMSFYGK